MSSFGGRLWWRFRHVHYGIAGILRGAGGRRRLRADLRSMASRFPCGREEKRLLAMGRKEGKKKEIGRRARVGQEGGARPGQSKTHLEGKQFFYKL